ncbi:DUF2986 domain-containing protein [Thiomicrospira pelophila]|uniref:DUF2986 domain-containing protein n=1 Tax=Thiomicrospira pelophila TaxID=934 RepID=UPI000571ABC2|nr:DUF2986 domain-containing protein [Thiomicrospira pelophila]
MNRQKKIYQKYKKKMQQAKAKNQPVKKPPYVSKAQRKALELDGLSQQTGELSTKPTDES